MTEVKKFTIKRSIWLRGEGQDHSYLLRNSDKKQCCVGIYLQACGLPQEELRQRRVADQLGYLNDVPSWLVSYDTGMSALYLLNDQEGLILEKREYEIGRMFAAQGVTVTFVD